MNDEKDKQFDFTITISAPDIFSAIEKAEEIFGKDRLSTEVSWQQAYKRDLPTTNFSVKEHLSFEI